MSIFTQEISAIENNGQIIELQKDNFLTYAAKVIRNVMNTDVKEEKSEEKILIVLKFYYGTYKMQ